MRRRDEIRSPALSRLSGALRAGIYAIGTGVWLTGVLWLVFHYFVVYPGRFGLPGSLSGSWSLTLHGAFAFAAIWMFGLLWGVHAPAGWSRNKRRLSGGLLAGLLGWLMVSGYLLYYAGGEEFRGAVSLVHWILGLVAPAAFVAHRLKGRVVVYVRDLIWRPVSSRPIRSEIAPAGED